MSSNTSRHARNVSNVLACMNSENLYFLNFLDSNHSILTFYVCVAICVVQNMSEKLQIYWTLKKKMMTTVA